MLCELARKIDGPVTIFVCVLSLQNTGSKHSVGIKEYN